MSSNHSRRSRAGPSHDDPSPENRPRPVQKLVQYIPGEHFSAWGERWAPAPPRQKSNKASTNSRPEVSVFKIEHGLSEFQLDPPPTPLTLDGHAPPIAPVVHSLSGRPTKRKNTKRKHKRTRRCVPSLASSLHQSPSASTRASREEVDLDTPPSGLFSTPLQTESVATSSTLSGGSLTPDLEINFYPVSQVYDNRNLLIPAYNYQCEMSAGSLTQRGPQLLPYGEYYSQVPPLSDTTLRWTPGDGANFFLSAPPAYYHHDDNQSYVGAMGRAFLYQSNHSSADPRLPHLSEPYTQPRGQPPHQTQMYDIDAPDKHVSFPYNIEDTQS